MLYIRWPEKYKCYKITDSNYILQTTKKDVSLLKRIHDFKVNNPAGLAVARTLPVCGESFPVQGEVRNGNLQAGKLVTLWRKDQTHCGATGWKMKEYLILDTGWTVPVSLLKPIDLLKRLNIKRHRQITTFSLKKNKKKCSRLNVKVSVKCVWCILFFSFDRA